MEEINLPNPEDVPCNVFVDRGRVLFVTHQVTHVLVVDQFGEPNTWGPYWNAALAVGAFSNPPVELGEEGSTVWAFIDEDDNLLAIDMPAPTENGVPREEVLSILRTMINEEDITEIIENVAFTQRDFPKFLGDIAKGQANISGDSRTVASQDIVIKVEEDSEAEEFLNALFSMAEENSDDKKRFKFSWRRNK